MGIYGTDMLYTGCRKIGAGQNVVSKVTNHAGSLSHALSPCHMVSAIP